MAYNYKDTLNLPQTEFPMRGNLAKREPARITHWEKLRLYEKIQEQNRNGKSFVLHDGPPFTNGDVHIGTALNKILKDIILRYKAMNGWRTPYVPGWDCHGLPIEHKVSQQMQKSGVYRTAVEIRRACAEFSNHFIDVQRGQFQRLGVAADWAREYKTMNPAYEAEILRTFAGFLDKGMVYRSKKPVYWSIPCKTALAEAEIEYKDHTSPSIWVEFEVAGTVKNKSPFEGPVSVVIWTTTPWTIPANLAIALYPRLLYVEVRHEGRNYLVAEALANQFIEDCGLQGATLGKMHRGEDLEGIETRHPFIDRASPIVLADYVTTDSGTGCVHTAPGHGLDDYLTGVKYNLEIYCPLDDGGGFVDDGRIPAELVGLTVLETGGRCPANEGVLKILRQGSALLREKKIEHQYPHCWRSKTPVVFRAMDQWFVSLDHNGMRQKTLAEIENVDWVPGWGKNRIRGAVESRPDWCISRQRSWGVPIPAFFDENGESYIDAAVVCSLAEKIEKQGTNYWFENDAAELLSGIELPDSWKGKTLQPGKDTLDVWIDSGSSHMAVLNHNEDLHWPADLYLEGSDQHRGWFQSSLWTAMVMEGRAPFKQIVTHGFIVNKDGTKISKSEEEGKKKSGKTKPNTSDFFVNRFGADILRLWVSSQDYRNDIPVSEEIYSHVTQAYRSIRNTLRFQVSNLFDFMPEEHTVPFAQLTMLDKWALHKTAEFLADVTESYQKYEFQRVYQSVNRFVAVTLSATYHDILKDRLYTLGPNSQKRRSSQTAIHQIFNILNRVLAPILAFTTDEVHAFAHRNEEFCDDSVHQQSWPVAPQEWLENADARLMEDLLPVRVEVNNRLETLRKEKVIGQSLEAAVVLTGHEEEDLLGKLKHCQEDLAELFIVSEVTLKTGPQCPQPLMVEAMKYEGNRCPRCWRWVGEISAVADENTICERCQTALEKPTIRQEKL